MEGALISAGIIPEREYVGIVEYYDPLFDGVRGRGRIKVYLGKLIKDYPYKLIEVLEEDIKEGLFRHNGKLTLKADEIIKCKIKIGKWGFTAKEVRGICMSTGMVPIEEFLPRVDSNKSYYEPPVSPLGARIRTPPRMSMMHQSVPCDLIEGIETPLLTEGNYAERIEELPKIKRISQEENDEQEK